MAHSKSFEDMFGDSANKATKSKSFEDMFGPRADADSALSYSVDRAQQLVGHGIQAVEDFTGTGTRLGQSIVEQQEADIMAGGYQPKYHGSLLEQDGIADMAGWLWEKTQENAATSVPALLGGAAAIATAPFSIPAALAITGGTVVLSGLMGAGEVAQEMKDMGVYTPGIALAGGAVIALLDRIGAGRVLPKSAIAKLVKSGMKKEAAEELVKQTLKTGITYEIAKRAFAEAATESMQEFVNVLAAASQGAEYQAGDLLNRGVDAFALGGTMGAGFAVPSAVIDRAGGVRENARNKVELTQEEKDSPIADADILAGKETLAEVDAVPEGNDILRRNGLPDLDTEVVVDYGEGVTQEGKVTDAFTSTDPATGVASDGIEITLDDGTKIKRLASVLAAAGVKITPRDDVSAKIPISFDTNTTTIIQSPLDDDTGDFPPQTPVAPTAPVTPAQTPPSATLEGDVSENETSSDDTVLLDPDTIETDAKTFQFKSGGDSEGVTNQLRGTKEWEPAFAGIATVWERADGRRFIVDGHQRLALAKKLKAEGQNVQIRATILRESDGIAAEEARFRGALKNLAEGGESTSALDIARVIRDGGETAKEEIARVIPPSRRAVKDGNALADLGDEAFGMVVNELVDPRYAAEVGRAISNPQQQLAALGYMAAHEPANVNQARLVVEQIRAAGFSEGKQDGLFGEDAFAETLILERAKVLDNALKHLKGMTRVFKMAISGESVLAEVGNVLDKEANEKGLSENGKIAFVIEKLSTRAGPISDALNEAARKLKEGRSILAVRKEFLDAVASAEISGERDKPAEITGADQEVDPDAPVRDPNVDDMFGAPPVEPAIEEGTAGGTAEVDSSYRGQDGFGDGFLPGTKDKQAAIDLWNENPVAYAYRRFQDSKPIGSTDNRHTPKSLADNHGAPGTGGTIPQDIADQAIEQLIEDGKAVREKRSIVFGAKTSPESSLTPMELLKLRAIDKAIDEGGGSAKLNDSYWKFIELGILEESDGYVQRATDPEKAKADLAARLEKSKTEDDAADIEASKEHKQAVEYLESVNIEVNKDDSGNPWSAKYKGKYISDRDLFDAYNAARKNIKGARFDRFDKVWRYPTDPTIELAKNFKESLADFNISEDGQAVTEVKAKIIKLRQEQDARPDKREDNGDVSERVSDETKALIEKGREFGIPDEIMADQVEDVGMIVTAYENGKKLFLVTSDAGTGKTFVLGGAIREMRNRGQKKFVYFTERQSLIVQIKRDLKDYGIDDVEFVTYAALTTNGRVAKERIKEILDSSDGAVMIFDEAHNIKNMTGSRNQIAGRFIKAAKMTIYASATPIENPTQAEYFGLSGVYDDIEGGFGDLVQAYGGEKVTITVKTKRGGKVDVISYRWKGERDGATADAIAFKEWFAKQGIYTYRSMKIDASLVEAQMTPVEVDQADVAFYNEVANAMDDAIDGLADFDPTVSAAKMQAQNIKKRILEFSKVGPAIERAKAALADGRSVVLFVETKASRHIGRFRFSQHYQETHGKDQTLHQFPEMERMYQEWQEEAAAAAAARRNGGDFPTPPRPFAPEIMLIAGALHENGIDRLLPPTKDAIFTAFGKDNVAEFTGDITSDKKLEQALSDFRSGKKKVMVATMAKGGTGLSIHDTVGDRPTTQIVFNLPWSATQVEQVTYRIIRYGLKSKAVVEWLFAPVIAIEHDLTSRVARRMEDMGATVKGKENVQAADDMRDVIDDDENVAKGSRRIVDEMDMFDGLTDQFVIEGAEKLTDREMAERQMKGKKKGKPGQVTVDATPLFGGKLEDSTDDQVGGKLEDSTDDQGSLFSVRKDAAEKLPRLKQALVARMRQLNITDRVALNLVASIEEQINGKMSALDGRYINRLIEVAMDAPNQMKVLNHEVIHALRDIGLIRDMEWRILEKAARADTDRMAEIKTRYPDLSEEAQVEEAIADMFSDAAADRTVVGGPLKRAYERVKNFIQALYRSLTKQGFKTVEDIFEGIERGEVGGRDVVREGGDDEIWNIPNQNITSAETSINSGKLPSSIKRIEWKPGTVNVDIGGGKFNNVTDTLKSKGVTNHIFDPFNRDAAHNLTVRNSVSGGRADTATINNVLNVIAESSNRMNVIKQAADAVGSDGVAYFLIYEGNKSGVGKPTSKGFQMNRPARDFMGEIREQFSDVQRSGNMITAKRSEAHSRSAKESRRQPNFGQPFRGDETEDVERETTAAPQQDTLLTASFDGPSRTLAEHLEGAAQDTVSQLKARAGFMSDTARMKLQDKFIWLKRTQEAIEKVRGKIDDKLNTYELEALFHGKTAKAIDDFHRLVVEPMIQKAHDLGLTLEDIDSYLYSRHAKERNVQIRKITEGKDDKGSGWTDEKADEVMAGFSAEKITALESIAGDVDMIIQRSLQRRIDAGLLSQKAAKQWLSTYKSYVPLRGFADETLGADHVESGRMNTGRGFSIKGAESLRALGRESEAGPILANVLMNADEAIIRAEKNIVMQSFFKMAQANPNDSFWEISKTEYTKGVNKSTGLVEAKVDARYTLHDNVMSVKVDGEQYYITVHHEGVARGMKNMGAEDTGRLTRALQTVNRYLAFVNTSANPEFMFGNFFRDVTTAAINLSEEETEHLRVSVMRDLKAALKGAFGGIKGKRDTEWQRHFHEYAKAGGKTDFFGLEDAPHKMKRLENMMAQLDPSKPLKVKRALRAVFDMIQDLNGAVENAVRLSTYVNARRTGTSEQKAAYLAKNLTVNFNRKGEWSAAAGALYLFYNASVQGSVRVIQALKSKKVQKVVGGVIATSFLLEFVNSALSPEGDDGEDEYGKITEYNLAHNLIIMNPWADKDSDTPYVKIPMPYGYNVFAVIGRKMAEVVTNKTGVMEASGDIVAAVAGSFNPIGAGHDFLSTITPTFLQPAVELATNLNYMGSPIMPEQNQFGPEKPESQLAFKRVSSVSKWIAETLNELTGEIPGGGEVFSGKIDFSPEILDHVAAFITGGAGSFASRAVDAPLKLASGEAEWNDVPIVRRFLGGPNNYYDQTRYRELSVIMEQVMLARRTFKGSARAALMSDMAVEISVLGKFAATRARLRKLYKIKKRASGDRVKAIDKAINEAVRRFNGAYAEAVKKQQ